MSLVPTIRDGDWVSVRRAIAKLASLKLGPTAIPVFTGIQLLDGGLITASTGDGDLKISPGGNVGIQLPDGVEPSELLSIGSTSGAEQLDLYHTGTHAVIRTTVGNFNFITKNTSDKNTYVSVHGNGSPGVGYFRLHDEDNAEYVEIRCSAQHGYIKTAGTAPGPIHLQDSAHSSVRLFANAAEGETKELMIYGRKTGDSRRSLEIGVGVDADDTASFDGLSNYLFDGVAQATDFAKTGWPITVGATFSFSYPTFTVTDGGSAYYYVDGVKYILGGNKTVDITDTEGLWYIYFDGATLTASQTIWSFSSEDKALVAILYWDAANNKEIFLGWEPHTFHMSGVVHARLHYAGGARWESGLLVSDAGSEQIDVSAGDIWDEDLNIPISDGAGSSLFEQVLTPAELPIYYRSGASDWRIYETTNKANAVDAGYVDGSDDLHYNKLNGTWASTAAGAAKYVAYFAIASNDQAEPVALIMGQRIDTTLAAAKENNIFSGLSLSGMPFEELIILARLILKVNAGSPYYTLEDITDLRSLNIAGNVTSPLITDHGGLGGLGDDDHVQYLLVDGTRAATALTVDEVIINDHLILGATDDIEVRAVQKVILAAGDDINITAVGMWASITTTIDLISGSTMMFKPSGDADDYIQFQTVDHVPEITTVGACDLKITASSGTIDFDDENLTTSGTLGCGTITSTGNLVIADAGNIGSASDTDAIAIAADGKTTFTQDLTVNEDIIIGDDKYIGSATTPTAIEISSDGSITINQALAVDASITVGNDIYVGDNIQVTGDISCDKLTLTNGQNYKFSRRGTQYMTCQGLTAGQSASIEFFNASGDSGESTFFICWATGLPGGIDPGEYVEVKADGPNSRMTIKSLNINGTLRPLGLWTGGNTDQLKLGITGEVYMAQAVDDDLGNLRDTYWDSTTGQIGYTSCSKRHKENIVDINDKDTSFLHLLRAKKYNKIGGFDNEIGLIAEEVEAVAGHIPNLISYRNEPIMGKEHDEAVDIERDVIVGHRVTDEPETVNLSRLIVPMLREIQKLNNRISMLEDSVV